MDQYRVVPIAAVLLSQGRRRSLSRPRRPSRRRRCAAAGVVLGAALPLSAWDSSEVKSLNHLSASSPRDPAGRTVKNEKGRKQVCILEKTRHLHTNIPGELPSTHAERKTRHHMVSYDHRIIRHIYVCTYQAQSW